MKGLMGVKHKLRNSTFRFSSGHGLQLLIAKEATRKMFFELHVERQGPQDSCNLEIGLIFPDNDDVSQKKLGLEASISSQDDPVFPLGNLN